MKTTLAGLDHLLRLGFEPWRYDGRGLLYFKAYNTAYCCDTYALAYGDRWVQVNLVEPMASEDWFIIETLHILRREAEWQTRSPTSTSY